MPLSTVLCPLLQQTTFQPAAAVLKHAVFHCWSTSIPKGEGSSLDLENPQKMQKSLPFECELTQADWRDLQPFHRQVWAVGCHIRVTLIVHILPIPGKGHGQREEEHSGLECRAVQWGARRCATTQLAVPTIIQHVFTALFLCPANGPSKKQLVWAGWLSKQALVSAWFHSNPDFASYQLGT